MKNHVRIVEIPRYGNPQSTFINGGFQVSSELEKEILEKYFNNTQDKSILYFPVAKILVVFHHTDVWGRGYGEQVNNDLPIDEVERLEKKQKNWSKARKLLFSIPNKHAGESYINVGNEPIDNAKIEKIKALGINVSIYQGTISIS